MNWRTTAAIALCVVVVGNLLSAFATSFETMLLLRGLIGLFGEGLVFSIGVAALGETTNSDRSFAIMVSAQVAWAVTGLFGLPYVAEAYGVAGIAVPVGIAIAAVVPTRVLPAPA